MVFPYRRFGTRGFHSKCQLIQSSQPGLIDPWRLKRYAVPKLRYGNTILRCVRSQKSADLIYVTRSLKLRMSVIV